VRVLIVGTGLIGASIGLALKSLNDFSGEVLGWDGSAEELETALRMGAIDRDLPSREAVLQPGVADVIVLATPVLPILDWMERLAPVLRENQLVTDVGSTKLQIVDRARKLFNQPGRARFLPGHPMAGKEHSGIEHANADLFRDAVWLLTPFSGQNLEQAKVAAFVELLRTIGARVMNFDPREHDRVCALVSHLPQMISTAFASMLVEELGGDRQAGAIGGRALREMTRIAGSPYSMWRDIALTNTKNIQEALLKLEQKLAHIRENLRTRGLEEEFEQGNEFGKKN
jgi:prephenate dehydrogenase